MAILAMKVSQANEESVALPAKMVRKVHQVSPVLMATVVHPVFLAPTEDQT